MLVAVVMVLVLVVAAGVVLVTRASAGDAGKVRNPPRDYAEPGHCVVVLGEAGPRRAEVIAAVRETTDVGPAQAKDWVEDAPCAVAGGLSRASADRLRARLESAGATAWVEDPSAR